MNTMYYTTDYEDDAGQKFRIEWHYDDDADKPWENSDGHGPVLEWEKRDKTPGELILHEARNGDKHFYDFQSAIKKAREENWGDWKSGNTPQEKGEKLKQAVMEDYEYLRAWCNGEWHYMGIVAFPLTEDGDELRSKSCGLWGIESHSNEYYIRDCTIELLKYIGASGEMQDLYCVDKRFARHSVRG